MTTVERFDDATTSWIEITQYESFKITNGVSDVQIAPTAQLGLPRTSEVAAGTRLRIREGTDTTFEGNVVRTKPRSQSAMRVDCEHDAYGLFEETISLNVMGSDEDVLQAALSAAGGSWTLSYAGSATTLGDTYEVEGRSVKRVFRDMVDRVGRVWWVGADHTIHVEPLGYRGTFASVDTSTDDAAVTEFTPDDVDTVVNDVTVVGTGGEKVTGGASDSGSITEYGRQPERTNVSYITTQGEAVEYANALLNPQPDSSATVRVGASVGDVASPIVNYSLDVTDTQGVGLNDELVVEKQTVTQGSAELELGEGAGVNIAKFNRREKSKTDVTEPGSVYNSDRIAEDAITTGKLVDTAVIEDKIADLSISETKVQDDAISTPKLRAEAVTAAKILAGTITATEIKAGTITANEITANTLTAAEIQTLGLSADQLSITRGGEGFEFSVDTGNPFVAETVAMEPVTDRGATIGTAGSRFRGEFEDVTLDTLFTRSGGAQLLRPAGDDEGSVGSATAAWSDVYAYEFIDAATGTPINDGGDPRASLQDESGPPKESEVTNEDGECVGYSMNRMVRSAWDVIREQDRVISELEDTVERLEARVDELDPNA